MKIEKLNRAANPFKARKQGGLTMNKHRMTRISIFIGLLMGMVLTFSPRLHAVTGGNSQDKHMAGMLYAYNETDSGRERVFLPLKKTDVHLDIMAGMISAQVTQRFVNEGQNALEAIYIFPLPAKATVTDMVLQVGDRTIRSVVQERQQAQQTYEKAKAKGQKTALLEQERANIFTTSIANILPGEEVTVTLTYLEEITYEKGQYMVNFPMVVGPRIRGRISRKDDGTEW